jgi:hypothetical protein
LQHKSSINRYKKTKIISCIFTRPQWNKTGNQEQKKKKPTENIQTHGD